MDKANTKPITIKGYKTNGSNVILTPTQMESMKVNYQMMEGTGMFESIDEYISTMVSNVLKSHNVTITSYQVGADKTGSNSDAMNTFLNEIDKLHKQFVDENKGEIFHIEGKTFWLDAKKKLREFSPTFTARTPEGYTSKSYQAHLMDKAKELGLDLDNEVKDVVETEQDVDEVVSEI